MTRSIPFRSSAAALLIAAALGAAPVRAQAEPPSAGAQEQAKQAFTRAEQAYQLGRFEQAIEGYTRAYELTRYPDLLFNLAQCHRHLGNWERAAFFYRRYLAQAPAPQTNRALAQELLAEVEHHRAKAEATARVEKPSTPLVVPVPAAALAPDPQPAAAPPPPLYERWWFWAGLGAVAVAGAATAVVVNSPPPKGTLGEIRF